MPRFPKANSLPSVFIFVTNSGTISIMARNKNLQMASRGFNEPSCSQTNGQEQLGTRKRENKKKENKNIFSSRISRNGGRAAKAFTFLSPSVETQSLSQQTNFRLDKEKYIQEKLKSSSIV
jgi:hypothetical protein